MKSLGIYGTIIEIVLLPEQRLNKISKRNVPRRKGRLRIQSLQFVYYKFPIFTERNLS